MLGPFDTLEGLPYGKDIDLMGELLARGRITRTFTVSLDDDCLRKVEFWELDGWTFITESDIVCLFSERAGSTGHILHTDLWITGNRRLCRHRSY